MLRRNVGRKRIVSVAMTMLLAAIVCHANLLQARPAETMPDELHYLAVPSIVENCSRKILGEVEGQAHSPSLPIGVTYTIAEDEETVKLILAIIYVESRFRPNLISKAKAYGLMQITKGAMLEGSEYCGLPVIPVTKLLDSAINIRYGSCYLHKLLEELNDIDAVLIVYNGGYVSLTRYLKGVSMNKETANYLLQVRRSLQLCNTEN